jgi:hypothetical protein
MKIGIAGERFQRDGVPTHAGRSFRGRSIEGLLFISRMANAVVDDRNPATRGAWDYADGPWDAERSTREFIAALPAYRRAGLDAVAVNMQGGSPQGYSWHQPWRLSGFAPDGTPYPDMLDRLARVLGAAEALGMAVNVGLFYGAAARSLDGEAAVLRAATMACDWLAGSGFANVLLEIGNEIDIPAFSHDIIKPPRCGELIALAKARAPAIPVSTSFKGGVVPPEHLMAASDYILLHGNRVDHPDGIRAMVAGTRASAAYRGQPILFNEDDHFDFELPDNNFLAAVESGAGRGFFDFRRIREGFAEGYQSLPVDWGITSERKRGFFRLLAEITGGEAPA